MTQDDYRDLINECFTNENLKGFEQDHFKREQRKHPDYSSQEFYRGLILSVNEFINSLHRKFKQNKERLLAEAEDKEDQIRCGQISIEEQKNSDNTNDTLVRNYKSEIQRLKSEIKEIHTKLKNDKIDSFISEEDLPSMNGMKVGRHLITVGLLTEIKRVIENCSNGVGIDKKKGSISIPEFALKCSLEKRTVTRENANEIVKEIGLNSGHKLYQAFNKFHSESNRTGYPGSGPKMKNKIKLFKRVIDLLSNEYKVKALDELKVLESRAETNDY